MTYHFQYLAELRAENEALRAIANSDDGAGGEGMQLVLENRKLKAKLSALEAQEPVGWQFRERSTDESKWSSWRNTSYKPQGPESNCFEIRPTFIAAGAKATGKLPPGEFSPQSKWPFSEKRIAELTKENERLERLVVAQRQRGMRQGMDGSMNQAEVERLTEELADARDSAEFYKRRVDLLQQWQSKMRDPERTIACDIIANGQTLPPEHAGDRYSIPEKQR